MKTQKSILVIGLTLLWVGTLVGCSQLAPTGPETTVNADLIENPPPCDLTHYSYPEAANVPPPGYQFIQLPSRGLDGDYDYSYGLVVRMVGREMWLDDDITGIDVDPNAIPMLYTWISVYRPDLEDLWIQFEPHGLVFNSPQRARISYDGCILPQGITVDSLTVWYWHEELNQYELIGGVNHPAEHYFEFDINHFSRYVVAGPTL